MTDEIDRIRDRVDGCGRCGVDPMIVDLADMRVLLAALDASEAARARLVEERDEARAESAGRLAEVESFHAFRSQISQRIAKLYSAAQVQTERDRARREAIEAARDAAIDAIIDEVNGEQAERRYRRDERHGLRVATVIVRRACDAMLTEPDTRT